MTLPNILVLRYLKTAGAAGPDVLMKAEGYIRLGYQRLLTFEVPGGGFSWFGEKPANVMLSAYGLMEFADMAAVLPIDEKILPRTRAWLLSKRAQDGSFAEPRSAWSVPAGQGPFALTAFATWALLASGASAHEVEPSIQYLLRELPAERDPYALALALNALALDESRRRYAVSLAARLVGMRSDEGWAPRNRTLVYSSGAGAQVEVTALVALGLLALRTEPAAARDAVKSILAAKDASGLWHTTQATVLGLKALLAEQTAKPATDPFEGTVKVTVNGKVAAEIPVSHKTYEVVQLVDLKEFTRRGDHDVRVEAALTSPQVFSLQLVSSYYLPWAGAGPEDGEGPLSIRQTFDRTTLAVDDRLRATVTLRYRGPSSGSMVLLDLGIPPGFALETESLDALVRQGTIARYEPAGRQVLLYLPPLAESTPVTFIYALRARFPMRAVTPPSKVYEYYNPDKRVDVPPVALEVR